MKDIVKSKPKANQKQTKSKPKANQKQTKSKPKAKIGSGPIQNSIIKNDANAADNYTRMNDVFKISKDDSKLLVDGKTRELRKFLEGEYLANGTDKDLYEKRDYLIKSYEAQQKLNNIRAKIAEMKKQ
jgi:hypothetical protein